MLPLCWLFFIVVVVVVGLYRASRSASNALNVPLCRKKMSFQRPFEAVGTPSRVPEWVWTVGASSIPSDGRRRKPDNQTSCDGVVESSTGNGWPIWGVGGLRRQMYACSSPSGTEELYSAHTSELWLRVFTGHLNNCESISDKKQNSKAYWWNI